MAKQKAYSVQVQGWAIKYLTVWADSVAEANAVAHDERFGPDVEVSDTHYGESGVLRSRTRRLPEEDRPLSDPEEGK